MLRSVASVQFPWELQFCPPPPGEARARPALCAQPEARRLGDGLLLRLPLLRHVLLGV